MRSLDPLWLLLAGIGGGLAGSVAGLASLVSYPALLAVGVPAVSASTTNTVALVFSGIGSVWGSRPELDGRWRHLGQLCLVGVAGGSTGAVLLLATPGHAFTLVVPWLIAAGSLGILLRRPAREPGDHLARRDRWTLGIAVYLTGLYGGCFGAAAGVILLAVLLRRTADTLAHASAASPSTSAWTPTGGRATPTAERTRREPPRSCSGDLRRHPGARPS